MSSEIGRLESLSGKMVHPLASARLAAAKSLLFKLENNLFGDISRSVSCVKLLNEAVHDCDLTPCMCSCVCERAWLLHSCCVDRRNSGEKKQRKDAKELNRKGARDAPPPPIPLLRDRRVKICHCQTCRKSRVQESSVEHLPVYTWAKQSNTELN